MGSKFFLKKAHKSHCHPALLNEYQARFSDIPFPFDGQILIDGGILNEKQDNPVQDYLAVEKELDKGFVSLHNHEQNYSEQDYSDETKAHPQNNSVFTITCLTDLSLPELRMLYHVEMEQLGWRERAFFQDNLGKEKSDSFGFTFIFEKPGTKLCIISAQTFTKKSVIIRYYRA